jgi:hypothetical protein
MALKGTHRRRASSASASRTRVKAPTVPATMYQKLCEKPIAMLTRTVGAAVMDEWSCAAMAQAWLLIENGEGVGSFVGSLRG